VLIPRKGCSLSETKEISPENLGFNFNWICNFFNFIGLALVRRENFSLLFFKR
jgi:hypothetical protein